MNFDIDNLENYVTMLSDDLSLVDGLSDEMDDMLINYLENEIPRKQEILEKLKNENN